MLYVKSGKSKSFGKALGAVCRDFYNYCNSSDVNTSTQGMLYPIALNDHGWLAWENRNKTRFTEQQKSNKHLQKRRNEYKQAACVTIFGAT